MSDRIEMILGDITNMRVDAIVNAANHDLTSGSGVNGAIHEKAGPGLLEECKELGACEIGEAKITKGFCLPAQYIIHTVGPIWQGGDANEEELLANCYRNCLALACTYKIRTIAFPSISTGINRFPNNRAARIAVQTVSSFLEHDDFIEQVTFCCFKALVLGQYHMEWAKLLLE